MGVIGTCVGLLIFGLFLILTGIHNIQEGHIGVYYRGGILEEQYSEAGFNWALPILSVVESVQITLQTDEVSDIPCGTSGGVMIQFEKIEVVNRLKKELAIPTIRNYTSEYDKLWIYDKIHHEINQFCSKHSLQEIYIDLFDSLDEKLIQALQRDLEMWAPGLEIVAIRITKPSIPASVRKNFEEMEIQRTKFLLESEKQKIVIQQIKSQGVQAMIKAQSDFEVAEISLEREIKEKLSQQRLSAIEDQMIYSSEMAQIDSHIQSQRRELETAQMRLTKEYLQVEAIKALSTNVKFYIGDNIPSYIGQFDKI